MIENADIFDFEMDEKDMSRLSQLTTSQNLDDFRSFVLKFIVRRWKRWIFRRRKSQD